MKYVTQAMIGVSGIIFCALVLVLSYAFFTNVSWIIPAFTIPFRGGFAYYSYASIKEKRQKKAQREAERKKKSEKHEKKNLDKWR